ncbi:hypothetical protein JCM10295v2_006749 [Rhodotorula toruloides]
MTSRVPYPPPTDTIQPVIAAFAYGLFGGLSFSASSSSTPRTPSTAFTFGTAKLARIACRDPDSASLPYTNSSLEEKQYLKLAHRVIESGELRSQVKGGTGARAIFAPDPLRFSLSRQVDPADPSSLLENIVPPFTTKRMPFGVTREEFAWMMRGETDAKALEVKGVKVWMENSSRDYLDSRGLKHLEMDNIDPAYGFQWRHAGADYSGYVDGIAVPPCPILHQFYLHEPTLSLPEAKPRLSCVVYQRSADICLGLPFDLVNAALLTHLVAHMTDSVADQLTYFIGDAHVYLDHEAALREQLARPLIHNFPTVKMARSREDIERDGAFDSIVGDDFQLGEYRAAPKLSFKPHL